jgi:hypothetical protein
VKDQQYSERSFFFALPSNCLSHTCAFHLNASMSVNIRHDLMYISDVALHVKARGSMEESQMLLWHPPTAFVSLGKMAINFIAIILIIWTVGYSSSTHNSHNPLNGQHLRVIWVCYSKIRSHNSNWIGNYFLFISHYGKEILKDWLDHSKEELCSIILQLVWILRNYAKQIRILATLRFKIILQIRDGPCDGKQFGTSG